MTTMSIEARSKSSARARSDNRGRSLKEKSIVLTIAASFGRACSSARMASSASGGSRPLMMPARRARPSTSPAVFGACFNAVSHRLFDEPRGERRHIERRDQSAESGVASTTRQRGDNLRGDGGIEFGQNIGRRRRSFRHEERNDRGFGRLRQRPPDIDLRSFRGLYPEELGDLPGRKRIAEQALDLAGVADEIGAGGEVDCEFGDQPIEKSSPKSRRAQPRPAPPRAGRVDRTA